MMTPVWYIKKDITFPIKLNGIIRWIKPNVNEKEETMFKVCYGYRPYVVVHFINFKQEGMPHQINKLYSK